jgi:hypothetical protein
MTTVANYPSKLVACCHIQVLWTKTKMISKLIATLQKYCNIGAKGEKKETI